MSYNSNTVLTCADSRILNLDRYHPITLKKKACLVYKFRVSKKLRDTAQKMSKSGLSWNDKESFSEMEKLKRFQGSTSDTIARRKLVEDRDTILGTHWQDTGITE